MPAIALVAAFTRDLRTSIYGLNLREYACKGWLKNICSWWIALGSTFSIETFSRETIRWNNAWNSVASKLCIDITECSIHCASCTLLSYAGITLTLTISIALETFAPIDWRLWFNRPICVISEDYYGRAYVTINFLPFLTGSTVSPPRWNVIKTEPAFTVSVPDTGRV